MELRGIATRWTMLPIVSEPYVSTWCNPMLPAKLRCPRRKQFVREWRFVGCSGRPVGVAIL